MAMNIEDGTVTIQDTSVRNLMSGEIYQRSNDSLVESIQPARHPTFFLYTKLNQNETKNLKKAKTNTEERKALAQIFNLKSILNVAPGESPNKVELLKLDFHYMNYDFCKKNQFSNEKTSTVLAIIDQVFTTMLEQILKPEMGLKMLREHLMDHTIQRPPFAIFIFTEQEVQRIIDFAMSTFLRHFSLYEFAFKPRVELVLRSDPMVNQKFNTELNKLDDMQEVDDADALKMKAFLGSMQEYSIEAMPGHQGEQQIETSRSNKTSPRIQQPQISDRSKASKIKTLDQELPEVDWRKVGKIHDANSDINDVIAKEMERLRKAFDMKSEQQLEDIFNKKTNPNAEPAAKVDATKKK